MYIRYPESVDKFRECKLDGEFDPQLSGTRMKLKVPDTWETLCSLHGNKPSVWQKLLGLLQILLLKNLNRELIIHL